MITTHYLDEALAYDGTQLQAHWILRKTGIADDAIVAWRGPCNVPFEQMADLEDLLAGDAIAGDDMLHFVEERFGSGVGIDEAIVRQRLRTAQAFELIAASPVLSAEHRCGLRRNGDDLWVGDAKLSISIATVSPVSTLHHFALDVTSSGTPVTTIGLEELGIDPRVFADAFLETVRQEEVSMRAARVKVRGRGGGGRMTKHFVPVVKVLLVAALMTWVFSNVQWSDTVVRTAPDGTESRVAGSIVDGQDWQGEAVRFVPSEGPDAGAEIIVRQTAQRSTEPGEPGGEPISPETIERVSPGFLTYWRNLDLGLFAIGALLFFVTANLAAVRWWWLLRINDLRVGVFEALRFSWIGIFWNNFVLGQTGGDVIKAVYVLRRCPGGRAEAVVSVLVDRILGLASLALLGAIVVLFALDEYAWLAVGIWLVLFAVVSGACIAFSRRLRRAFRIDRLLARLPGKLGDLLKKVDAAVFHYRGHVSGILLWLVLGMANHAIAVCSWLFVGRALGIDLPPLQYFVLIPVINIVSAVPIAPNGWGVGEALFGRLFGDWGAANLAGAGGRRLMATQGVALSILYRIHLTLWSLIGGLLSLFDPQKVDEHAFDDDAPEVSSAPEQGAAAGS